MAYERQTWDTGTVISESKLLHIEDGLYDVTNTADQAASESEQNTKDISTLNSALTESTSVTSGTGTINTTYISPDNLTASWRKYGRICEVDLCLRCINTASTNDVVVSGLPAPLIETQFLMIASSASKPINMRIGENGTTICPWYTGSMTGSTDTTYDWRGSFTYITAS